MKNKKNKKEIFDIFEFFLFLIFLYIFQKLIHDFLLLLLFHGVI